MGVGAKLSGFSLRRHIINPLKAGSWWHPRYFAWLAEKKRFPELDSPKCDAIMRATRYCPFAMKFLGERGLKHLFDHDLTPESVVLDVGAYTGEWSREIYARYTPRIMAFEPVPKFYLEMSQAFSNEPKVSVYNFGLSDSNRHTAMEFRAMGSSEFTTSNGFPTINVEMRDVGAVFSELQIEAVDLLKVNIEGGEFPLLERMLECNLMPRCKKVMVQFHKHVMPTRRATKWREQLVSRIELTHVPVFSFPFVWECWSLRRSDESPQALSAMSNPCR